MLRPIPVAKAGPGRGSDDPTVTTLSVFTDNGAFYNAPVNGFPSTAVLTEMLEVLRRVDVPVSFVQLDDFWSVGRPLRLSALSVTCLCVVLAVGH